MQEQRARTRNSIVERLARAELSPEENAIRKAIQKAFAEEGTAPSVEEVAQMLGLPFELVREACRRLAAYDLIVWRDDEARILSAYPFSGVPTAHPVLLDGHPSLYAMCAIDALGIPFMLGRGASIRSACFFCHKPVRIEMKEGLLQRAEPSTLVIWSSEREGCCVAEARCPLMNFFCDEAHLQAWLATAPDERGTRLSLLEALDVGETAFGELLKGAFSDGVQGEYEEDRDGKTSRAIQNIVSGSGRRHGRGGALLLYSCPSYRVGYPGIERSPALPGLCASPGVCRAPHRHHLLVSKVEKDAESCIIHVVGRSAQRSTLLTEWPLRRFVEPYAGGTVDRTVLPDHLGIAVT